MGHNQPVASPDSFGTNQVSSYQILMSLDLGMKAKKDHNSAIPYALGGRSSTKLHLWPNQEPWRWVVGHHYGKRVQDGEVEERESGVVCVLRTEVGP